MTKSLMGGLAFLLLIPSAASAATVTADTERRQGTTFGPVTFKAAKGEVNRVTVTIDRGRLRFRDGANRVKARGDCRQAGRHTAICPRTEDFAKVKLGNRSDTATGAELVEVYGGPGADVLRGSSGNDRLFGGRGNDTLRGGRSNDVLTGGPGRDRVFGGSGDDTLVDGESDRSSARDLYRGGSSRDSAGADRGDVLDYSKRRRAVRVDLRSGKSNTRDRILGLESVIGGRGNDRLLGDGDDNNLEGGPGNDVLRGRGGDDIPMGGAGNDTVAGGAGNDTVWGHGGVDRLSGGSGDDQMISRDETAETVACGDGDDIARNDAGDTLTDCEVSTSGSLYVKTQPQVSGNTATFQVACQRLGGCAGKIAIAGLDGKQYGNGTFKDLPDDPQTFSSVEVQLTGPGREALAKGEVVQVTYGDTGGYRA